MILIWLDLAVLCCHWIVFFFFFGSTTGVCGYGWWADGGGGGSSCGWWVDGGVGVYGSVGMGFGSVGGRVGLLPGFFFFFFFFLGIDGKLWVVVGGGDGSVRCVVRRWW